MKSLMKPLMKPLSMFLLLAISTEALSLQLPFNFLTWNTPPLTGLKLMCIRSMASVDLARKVPTEYVCQHCVWQKSLSGTKYGWYILVHIWRRKVHSWVSNAKCGRNINLLMCKTIIIAQRVPGLRTLGSNLILLQDGAFTFEIQLLYNYTTQLVW